MDSDLDPAFRALEAVVRFGDLTSAERIFEQHASLSAKLNGPAPCGDFGGTLLMAAVQHRNLEMIDLLIRHGADIDARDVDHESTPAQWMIRERQDVVRFLVTRGCRTDILMAAALGDLSLVREFLDTDPGSIRTRVSAEYFPMRGERAGGSIYIWTLGSDKTAHILAREFGHDAVFRLLMERSSDELQLSVLCALGDVESVTLLLARRPNIAKTLGDDERRAIAHAARNESTAAVRLMLEAGWPVDARGGENATPLHWAAWLGNLEMVLDLVKFGAPLNVRGDTYDGTPLGWALHGSVFGYRRTTGDYAGVVEALLIAGAEPPPLNSGMNVSAPVRAALARYSPR